MMRIKLRHAPLLVGSLFFPACADDSTPSVDTDETSSSTGEEDTTTSVTDPDPDTTTTTSADSTTTAEPTTTTEDPTTTDSGDCVIPVSILEDGSFEAGANSSPWGEASSAFGTPLCDKGTCGADAAQDGNWFVWLGGSNGGDIGGVSQEVTIPDVDGLELTFYFLFSNLGNGGNVFQVQVDGDVLWEITDADAADYADWTQVTIAMDDYADGGDHDIDFTGIAATGNGSLFLDNVVLEGCAGGSITESDTVDEVMTGPSTDTETTTDSDTETGGDLVCEDVGSALPLAQAGDNTGAGDDYEPTCTIGDGGNGPEVSYTWTAPTAGTYRIDTLGSAVDTVLTVLDACDPGATELACNDDFGSLQSSVIVSLAQDQTIAIIVDAWDANSAGPFTLNINQLACEAPTDLGNGEPVEIDDDNLGAGDDTAATCGGVGGEDVIYSWTAPSTGLYAVYALSLEMSPVVSAYAGTCGDPAAEIGCGAGQNLSSFLTAFEGGEEVTIVVDGADAAQVGTYELNIEAAGDIAGDCCAADDSSGCESVPVTQCVCGGDVVLGFDPGECCTGSGEWTAQCAGYAASQCDAGCDLVAGGTCCVGDSGNPGCDAAPVEACVCEFDSFCCEGEWDDQCVATAVALCQAEC